jgi:glycosyltransferase involved in cell wall biosynthesis
MSSTAAKREQTCSLLSFVIPAHNEEQALGATLVSLKAAARLVNRPSEIIVVDDASTDRTAEIARQHGASVTSVHVRNIGAARNCGAAVARGDVLVFVDADTIVTADALAAAVSAIEHGSVGGGARVSLASDAPPWGRAVWAAASWYYHWRGLAAGCFLFVRRDAFEAAGRFDETYFATEEIHLSRALKARGRFVLLSETVTTSGRKLQLVSPWEFAGGLFRLVCAGSARFKSRHPWWYRPLRGHSARTHVEKQR